MTSSKKDARFQIRMTEQEHKKLTKLASEQNCPLGRLMIDSTLKASPINPLYKKDVQSFLLHLEQLQKVLNNPVKNQDDISTMHQELSEEARALWQSLNMQIENM